MSKIVCIIYTSLAPLCSVRRHLGKQNSQTLVGSAEEHNQAPVATAINSTVAVGVVGAPALAGKRPLHCGALWGLEGIVPPVCLV